MQRGEPSLECAVPGGVVRVAAQIVTQQHLIPGRQGTVLDLRSTSSVQIRRCWRFWARRKAWVKVSGKPGVIGIKVMQGTRPPDAQGRALRHQSAVGLLAAGGSGDDLREQGHMTPAGAEWRKSREKFLLGRVSDPE